MLSTEPDIRKAASMIKCQTPHACSKKGHELTLNEPIAYGLAKERLTDPAAVVVAAQAFKETHELTTF